MQKLQKVKKKVVRLAPVAIATTGGAAIGAVLMYRHIDYNAHFMTVHSGILAEAKKTGGGFLFETKAHGRFVLAPVVSA